MAERGEWCPVPGKGGWPGPSWHNGVSPWAEEPVVCLSLVPEPLPGGMAPPLRTLVPPGHAQGARSLSAQHSGGHNGGEIKSSTESAKRGAAACARAKASNHLFGQQSWPSWRTRPCALGNGCAWESRHLETGGQPAAAATLSAYFPTDLFFSFQAQELSNAVQKLSPLSLTPSSPAVPIPDRNNMLRAAPHSRSWRATKVSVLLWGPFYRREYTAFIGIIWGWMEKAVGQSSRLEGQEA